MYNIEWINNTASTVDYSLQALAEYDAGQGDRIDDYTLRFEREFADLLRGCDSDDIGGLIVYVNAGEVRAVYDYENFCGWIA